ncbi:hypothetical protein ACFWIY_15080 [Streptomyces sioyaensis]|uniref:hypothetical protein n=1 Tax=Streptomyces sioyaensis TaxID=67364 RepID=UPI003649D763
MAGGNIKISPDEMREASTWLQNQKELMQQSLHEANTKMDEMVEAAYATPGSESKFRPYWEEYKNGTEKAIEGLQGVSERYLIGDSASLYHAAGDRKDFKSVAGDSKLAHALDEFDKAWAAGHERVHDNVKTFAKNVDTISENFTKTDEDSVNALEKSKKDA